MCFKNRILSDELQVTHTCNGPIVQTKFTSLSPDYICALNASHYKTLSMHVYVNQCYQCGYPKHSPNWKITSLYSLSDSFSARTQNINFTSSSHLIRAYTWGMTSVWGSVNYLRSMKTHGLGGQMVKLVSVQARCSTVVLLLGIWAGASMLTEKRRLEIKTMNCFNKVENHTSTDTGSFYIFYFFILFNNFFYYLFFNTDKLESKVVNFKTGWPPINKKALCLTMQDCTYHRSCIFLTNTHFKVSEIFLSTA